MLAGAGTLAYIRAVEPDLLATHPAPAERLLADETATKTQSNVFHTHTNIQFVCPEPVLANDLVSYMSGIGIYRKRMAVVSSAQGGALEALLVERFVGGAEAIRVATTCRHKKRCFLLSQVLFPNSLSRACLGK